MCEMGILYLHMAVFVVTVIVVNSSLPTSQGNCFKFVKPVPKTGNPIDLTSAITKQTCKHQLKLPAWKGDSVTLFARVVPAVSITGNGICQEFQTSATKAWKQTGKQINWTLPDAAELYYTCPHFSKEHTAPLGHWLKAGLKQISPVLVDG